MRLDEWRGKTDFDVWPREIAEEFRKNDLAVLSTSQPVVVSEETPAPDGGRCYWWNAKFALEDASGRRYVGGIGIDITERKQAEDALRESEERLMLALSAGGLAAWDMHLATGRVIWNDEHFRMLGYSPGEVEPSYQAWAERVHPEDRVAAEAAFARGLECGGDYAAEYRTAWPDGTVRWVEARGHLECGAAGEAIRSYGVLIDITERRKAEEAIRQGEERFRSLAENIPSVLMRFDRQFRAVYLNTRSDEYNAIPASEILGKSNREIGMPAHLCDLWENAMETVFQTGKPAEVEFEFEGPSGPRAFLLRFAPEFSADAKRVEYVLGVSTDITERKRTQQALAAANRQAQTVIDNTPAIVYAFDLEQRFLMANAALAEMLDSTPERMIGKRRHEFMPRDDAEWHEANDCQVIETGRALEFEEHSSLKGRSITWLTTKFPLRDSNGRIYAVAGISTDASERKEAERRERELEAHKLDFYRHTLLAATEGKLLVCEKQEIIEMAGPALASWRVSDADSFTEATSGAKSLAVGCGMDTDRAYEFLGGVVEAATNVVKHAGGGEMSVHGADDRIVCVFSDSGPGIGAMALPDVALTRFYSTAGTLGMGYKLMLKFSDRVYLATGPGGTTVAIEMALRRAETLPPG